MKSTTIETGAKVRELIKLSEEQYVAIVRNAGHHFAVYFSRYNTEAAEYLLKVEGYWKWWKLQVENRNQVFLHEMAEYASVAEGEEGTLFELWRISLEAENIKGYPTDDILAESIAICKADWDKYERINNLLK